MSEQLVRQMALARGLNPDLAVSVWQQESGRSIDTSLKGQALSRNRGHAIGPWQVVQHYHPEFPVSGSFEDQTAYALDYLKEVGPARYYGTGQAPKGHPTSQQYVSQVMSRVPDGYNIPASAITGDPSIYSGSRMPVSAIPPDQGASSMFQLPPPPAPPTQAPMSPMGQMMMDPILAMGLGMLSSSLSGGNFGQALQSGVMGGYGNALAMQQLRDSQQDRNYGYQQDLWKHQTAQAKLDYQSQQEQAEQAQQLAYAEQAGLSPAQYARFMMGDTSVFDAYSPEIKVIDDEVVRINPDGSAERVPIAGMPEQTPGTYEFDPDIGSAPVDEEAKIKMQETRNRQKAADTSSLRKEYQQGIEGNEQRLGFWESVRDIDPASAVGNSAEQRVFMVSFAKMMEPTAAVMEGDAKALAAGAKNNPIVDGFYKKYVTSGLAKEDMDQMKLVMRESAHRSYGDVAEDWLQYKNIAESDIGAGNVKSVVGTGPMTMRYDQARMVPPQGIPRGSVRATDPDSGKVYWRAPDETVWEQE